ncbi:hypothetical protein P3T36_001950 [Kitasatospora sp. MAP12-15]|uniref:hypothetical protein n=1 Tax=unclassified Kitasatospora TaxID=2633591 RepID=UPI0024764294|nr:hypothetical protein [Kitasatospora sp. MAP12-44]MDH6111634.1 hypothetical protein [Kitasatospora sp. MAP12-44]
MKSDPGPIHGPPEEPAEQQREAPPETEAQRRRRRAVFLRELAEARELRARVQPRKTKERRMREALRMRTFRI